MLIRIFTIPILGGEDDNIAMNNFMSTHKVIDVRSELVDNKYWTFCMRYLDSKGEGNIQPKQQNAKEKIDYREILSVEEFGIFAIMREIRKEMANEKGVPPYAIFTDAELAQLCKLDELTSENAKKIKGIGKAHMEYIEQMIKRLDLRNSNEEIQSLND